MTDGPKILTLDIESSPHKVWSFQIFKTVIYPESIIDPSRTICWSAKWLDRPTVMFMSEYHHGYLPMLERIRNLIDEADVVSAYNGDRFDLPRLRQQFTLNRVPQPSPVIQVDLLKVIKRVEQWPSYKLSYITQQLGMQTKLDAGGLILWRECMGDFGEERQRKAWTKMRRYSKRDTPVLEGLFTKYRSDINNLPSLALFNDDLPGDHVGCPSPLCGSANVTRQGYRRTKTRRYPRYQCQDCGKWFSDTRSDKGVQSA